MTTRELNDLVACMKKECKAEETAVSLLDEMASVEKRLMSSGKPTKDDVALLKGLAKKVAKYRVNAETTRCMAEKCTNEYKALTEKNMKKTAARLKEAAETLERLLGKSHSYNPVAKKASKKPSSQTVKRPSKKGSGS